MLAFRIADRRHQIYSATGAMLHGGRWNSVGKSVIYSAETYAGALLEVLAHANMSHAPTNHRLVTITIPEDIFIETLLPEDLPEWYKADVTVPRSFGDQWLLEARSAVLRVPGMVTNGRENNLLLNPAHPDFRRVTASEPESVYWDPRIFHTP